MAIDFSRYFAVVIACACIIVCMHTCMINIIVTNHCIPRSLWLRDVRVLPVDIVEVASEYQEGQHQQKHQDTKKVKNQ